MIFKLLVVDDEVTIRKGISNYMNWASIDCQVVGSASDGVEAMEFLDREPVDIVITDIKMPATDGLDQGRGIFPEGSADAGAYRPPLHFGIKRKTPVPWTYHGVLLCCSLQTCVRRS